MRKTPLEQGYARFVSRNWAESVLVGCRQLRPVCKCADNEYESRSCDESSGRAVECGKCADECGLRGTCAGPGAADCTSCGSPLVNDSSEDTASDAAMMFFVPNEPADGRGACRACEGACPAGFFMTSPCTETAPVVCQECTRCQVRQPRAPQPRACRRTSRVALRCVSSPCEHCCLPPQDGERALVECDSASSQDAVCVRGEALPVPSLQPDGPVLLPEGMEKVGLGQLHCAHESHITSALLPNTGNNTIRS